MSTLSLVRPTKRDKIKFKQFLNNLFFYFSLLIKVNINKVFTYRKSPDIVGSHHGHKNEPPVRIDIRTFLEKKLLRLEQTYPRNCMDKSIRMHTKMHTNWERRSAIPLIAGFTWCEKGDSNPISPPRKTWQLQGLWEVSPNLYANLYAKYPYNLLEIEAPVSKVSSPERCE